MHKNGMHSGYGMSFTQSFQVLLPDGTEASIKEAQESLLRFFKSPQETRSVTCIVSDMNLAVLTLDDWTIRIDFQSGESVQSESRELAEHYGHKYKGATDLASCSSRFVIACDSDPGSTHINDMIWMLGCLNRFEGAITFDCVSCNFF